MNRVRGFTIILMAAIGLPALFLASAYLPGTRLVPYFVLLAFFWGLWLVPVALIILVAHFFRKRQAGPLVRIAGGYAALMLGFGIYLTVWGVLQGSSRYMQVGGKSPYHLTAATMAGFDTVTLGIKAAELPGTRQATIVTAPASQISAINASRSGGRSYSLRLIAASPDVTWTVEPGEGVRIEGDRTIAPGTYRDFTITTNGNVATMKSVWSGRCSLDRDPHECRR